VSSGYVINSAVEGKILTGIKANDSPYFLTDDSFETGIPPGPPTKLLT
jgi:hypothetical protein